MSEDTDLIFSLPEDENEVEETTSNYRPQTSDSDLVSIKRTEEEVRALRQEQEAAKKERIAREQQARIYQFEEEYADIDVRQKSYIKAYLRLQTELTEKLLAEEKREREELKNKIAATEIRLDKVAAHTSALDYREAMNEITHIALTEKTKAKFPNGKVESRYVDFALSEYELRRANDPQFNQQILSITNDPKLSNQKIKDKLATLIARNVEKALVEKVKVGGSKALLSAEVNLPSKKELKETDAKQATTSKGNNEEAPPARSAEIENKIFNDFAKRLIRK